MHCKLHTNKGGRQNKTNINSYVSTFLPNIYFPVIMHQFLINHYEVLVMLRSLKLPNLVVKLIYLHFKALLFQRSS